MRHAGLVWRHSAHGFSFRQHLQRATRVRCRVRNDIGLPHARPVFQKKTFHLRKNITSGRIDNMGHMHGQSIVPKCDFFVGHAVIVIYNRERLPRKQFFRAFAGSKKAGSVSKPITGRRSWAVCARLLQKKLLEDLASSACRGGASAGFRHFFGALLRPRDPCRIPMARR